MCLGPQRSTPLAIDTRTIDLVWQGSQHHRPFRMAAGYDLTFGVRHLFACSLRCNVGAWANCLSFLGMSPDSTKSTFAAPGPNR